MIDIILLIFLAIRTGELAVRKGLQPWPWRMRLIIFWFLGEFIGIVIGIMLFGTDNLVSCALVAIGCALAAYFIISNYLRKLPDV